MDRIATPELIRSLADASRESRRQVGALVHRSGEVDYVVVGHATGLMLPDIGRLRAAEGIGPRGAAARNISGSRRASHARC